MAAGGIAILNHEQLRRLASILYHQEVDAVQQIKFPSEIEVAKYIRDSRANYLSALALLDSSAEFLRKFEDSEVKSGIARDIFYYVGMGTNIALQSVRNFHLRSEYLTKIGNHANELMQRVETSSTESEVEELAKEAVEFSVFREFSIFLKETGVTYAELVGKYQRNLRFPGQLEDLEDVQKTQVYEKKIIITASSGHGNPGVLTFAKGLGSSGLAVLIFIASLIVWGVFQSEHKVRTVTEDGVSAVAYIGAGITSSIAGAYLLGFFLSRPSVGTPLTTNATDDYYRAPMPVAEALARQILHLDNHPSA